MTLRSISLLTSALAFLLAQGGHGQGRRCTHVHMVDAPAPLASSEQRKIQLAKLLRDLGFEDQAYVTRWKALTEKAKGPLDPSGDLVVTSVTHENLSKWMDEVGDHSIGIGVDQLAEDNPGTAMLRVGDKIFDFSVIRSVRQSPVLQASFDLARGQSGQRGTPWTLGSVEATFLVTPQEKQAVLNFIKARQNGITATRKIPGYEVGQDIRPKFDAHKFTLKRESCAAACTSWMDSRWLEHYKGSDREVLYNLAKRLNVRPHFVAKQNIWENSRNAQTLGLTVIGLTPDSMVSSDRPFIEANKWFYLRGMPVHGMIPDPTGKSRTIEATRLSLTEWLARVGSD